ncbi:putative extracellular SCP domain protein Pry1 [Aspergillus brunneoviolaceus CBS 621.78]|uniref:PR-1-like protein n=1 Tax=Aspergillus brunneoviolaceus CBS 621.78 TaxID=1450534 RepID=A0ACD1GP53_9EURO|nr:PR-1-like protein [Aspergillus brunneoviolaceus CBS 621.78]RAH50899.1 PR-1-like protein [Aspergillus brunneoviolaceus CBS 621.78]
MTTNNLLPSTTRSAITTTTTLHWLYITITILLLLTALTAADPALTQQATTIIVVTVTATTVATPTVPHPPSYTSFDLFANTILSVTNTYRQAHNASNLIWNKSLAEYAKKWAEGCKWAHSHSPYGENLAFGFPNASAAVAAWGDEGLRYNFREPTGFTEETGHFTQLVWRATTEVGCAAVDCGVNVNDGKDSQGTKNGDTANKNGSNNGEGINGIQRPQGWYVVCEYTPPGNVIGGNEKLGDKAFFRINVQASSTYSGPWQTAGNNGGSKTSVASSTSGAAAAVAAVLRGKGWRWVVYGLVVLGSGGLGQWVVDYLVV